MQLRGWVYEDFSNVRRKWDGKVSRYPDAEVRNLTSHKDVSSHQLTSRLIAHIICSSTACRNLLLGLCPSKVVNSFCEGSQEFK